MNNLVYEIRTINDFLKLRNLKENETAVIAILNDIDFNGVEFKPINAFSNNIIIYGFDHTISNLTINNGREEHAGLFGEVNSIYVRDLNFVNINVKGGVYSGSLAGEVNKKASVTRSSFLVDVDAEAYAGGIVGVCDDLVVTDTNIKSSVKGYDVVGGLAGMADRAVEVNNIIDSTVNSIGKASGRVVGYLSTEHEEEIKEKLLEEMEHLPVVCSNKEMRILELMIKNR